jgi:hypothetical protein
LHAGIALVHQHGAALEQVAVTLEHKVSATASSRGMPPGSQRRPAADPGAHQRFLKCDLHIAREHRLADADQAIAIRVLICRCEIPSSQ